MIKQGFKKNLSLKRKLRSEMTPAESKLWLRLRSKQFQNLKFRRQHGIGSYIVDFFCPEKRLAIEVDGDIHALERQIEKDRLREEYLKNLGIHVVRYTNNDILKNLNQNIVLYRGLLGLYKRSNSLYPFTKSVLGEVGEWPIPAAC